MPRPPRPTSPMMTSKNPISSTPTIHVLYFPLSAICLSFVRCVPLMPFLPCSYPIQCASVCSQADSFPHAPAPPPSAHVCARCSPDPPSHPNAVRLHITLPRKTMPQAPCQSEIQTSPYASPHTFILLLLFHH